jgi:molybdopterin-dependent oxidoreductase alpha subunit
MSGAEEAAGAGVTGWLRDHFPLGLLEPRKPRHFRAILRTVWGNAGQLGDAWRVLNGPCNGCAVQTDGLRDNVLPDSPHVCLTRLGLIEEALRRPLDPSRFEDVAALERLENAEIEQLGRIGVPLVRMRGQRGFSVLSPAQAYDLAAEWLRRHRGDRCGFFTTSKAVGNEEYYAFQQFARAVGGTNHLDSCARQCHAASVSALKAAVGVGAATGSLSDFIEADVLVLAGTNLAMNQPLIMRYIEHARRTRGGRPYVIVVNPYLEPGLRRYWVPSSPLSALGGTKICDLFIRVRVGGDAAFFSAVLKRLIEGRRLSARHRRFIGERTTGFEAIAGELAARGLDELAREAGVTPAQIDEAAVILAGAERVTFAWGMGLTQHAAGTENVLSVVNLALALGQFGRPGAGVAPLRGQSSVQSAGECGVAPNIFPGGEAVGEAGAARLSARWGVEVPSRPGLATGPMLEAAERGEVDLLLSLGGNLLDTMPDRGFVRRALSRVPWRIRLDVMMNREALVEPGEGLLVLPIRNWYEWEHVFTTTSTDRTIRAFGGSIRPRCAGVEESWVVLREIARRVLGEGAGGLGYRDTDEIRREMGATIWMYRGIERLDEPHRWMQWGGPCLFEDGFERMPGGRARFIPVRTGQGLVEENGFVASTRRGWGQWNSQHRRDTAMDYTTGATSRRDVLMNPGDAARLGLAGGRAVVLRAAHGANFAGTCRPDEAVGPGHVQLLWPAANDLLPHGRYDPSSVEPDYTVVVEICAG